MNDWDPNEGNDPRPRNGHDVTRNNPPPAPIKWIAYWIAGIVLLGAAAAITIIVIAGVVKLAGSVL